MNLTEFLAAFNFGNWSLLFPWIRGLLLLIFGIFIVRILVGMMRRFTRIRYTPHIQMLLIKTIRYFGYIIVFIMALNEMGFNLSALLGAAGIIGMAVGFASQTSISNIISGLFLIYEEPFQVDDLIKIGDTMGIVITIDLLSVKLKTFDNQFVRIPNENLIKTEIKNISRFPIRRLDIPIGVSYNEDISRVFEILLDIAAHNAFALKDPEPVKIFDRFGGSSIDLLFCVWTDKDHYLDLKNSIMIEIHQRFNQEGIEIPFPQRVVTMQKS